MNYDYQTRFKRLSDLKKEKGAGAMFRVDGDAERLIYIICNNNDGEDQSSVKCFCLDTNNIMYIRQQVNVKHLEYKLTIKEG